MAIIHKTIQGYGYIIAASTIPLIMMIMMCKRMQTDSFDSGPATTHAVSIPADVYACTCRADGPLQDRSQARPMMALSFGGGTHTQQV